MTAEADLAVHDSAAPCTCVDDAAATPLTPMVDAIRYHRSEAGRLISRLAARRIRTFSDAVSVARLGLELEGADSHALLARVARFVARELGERAGGSEEAAR